MINNKKIDLNAAIKARKVAPQGTLEDVEAATLKRRRNVPRKDPKDKITEKIVVGFTKAEYDEILLATKKLSIDLLGINVTPSTFVKCSVLRQIKNN